MSPQRIRLSRKKGWRLPEGAIIVSRPHHLGNPFKVYEHCKGPDGDWGVEHTGRLHEPMGHGWTREGAHRAAVNAYRTLLDEVYPEDSTARAILALEYAGHDLACWCPLDLPCHADVLLEVVNDPKYAELVATGRAAQHAEAPAVAEHQPRHL